MAQRLNKKILCFLDEHGTAGVGDLYLGAVLLFAHEAGAVDKRFSDLLPASIKEVRASHLDDRFLQGLLTRLIPRDNVLLINRRHGLQVPAPPRIYAQAVIETIKIGIKRFRAEVAHRSTIGNVEVLVDANHHNTHPEFVDEIERAGAAGGVFRGVTSVSAIDPAASRLLQLADVVAHARTWHSSGELTAGTMRQRFGIHIL